jgi:conjugative transfer signal peptidase TraF
MGARDPILAMAGLALCALFAPDRPRLVWNATASAPVGLYAIAYATPLRRGELVLAELPGKVRALAANRGYLPLHVPLIKQIAALPNDRICAPGNRISINERIVALRLSSDSSHRPLPAWHGCHTLTRQEVFLLMARVPTSFDGRYFGTVAQSAILGKLNPLWLR